MIKLSLHERLSRIQQELKARKGRKNSFGNYKYRSAEDILEALKPFNSKYNVYFTISEDTIIKEGFPIMLRCTASMHDANPPKYYKSGYESFTIASFSQNVSMDATFNDDDVVKEGSYERSSGKKVEEMDIEPGFRWEEIDNQTTTISTQSIVGVDLAQKGMATPQQFGSASSYGKKYALGNLLLIDDTADSDATNTHGSKPTVREAMNAEQLESAKAFIKGGGKLAAIEKKYELTNDQRSSLS